MKYPLCPGFPRFAQGLVTPVVIQAARGESFGGLGAMLLASIGVPLTAIISCAVIRLYPQQSPRAHVDRHCPAGLLLPALQMALLILLAVLRLSRAMATDHAVATVIVAPVAGEARWITAAGRTGFIGRSAMDIRIRLPMAITCRYVG
ncbi:MAG: hypothetical protein EHM16_09605 [Betaproteobacteria bacterium]|nr:MAG: hypothetical protein EHM16_09605 [Betaproteobacteria bacterium]